MNKLIQTVLNDYTLNPYGIHGLPHWARVLENGERLAEETGADLEVVRLFAVFHDSRRLNENIDQGHGLRGAELARKCHGSLFDLTASQFDLLYFACAHHTDGKTEADITVQTCWDADRLDLGRVGINPHPRYLCTEAAKNQETLEWANRRALEEYESPLLKAWTKFDLRD